jgi:hypothetical protein
MLNQQFHAYNPNTSCLSRQCSRVAASSGFGRESTVCPPVVLTIQVIVLVGDVAIAYAGQRISPTTVTICVYGGVSEIFCVMG